MEKIKRKTFVNLVAIILIVVLLGSITYLFSCNRVCYAATDGEKYDVEPRGIMTKISLTIGASDGYVWARARNYFTLGNSTVRVVVELYSSTTYTENISDMKCERSESISDLNLNKTLEAKSPVNGQEKYWRARVQFRLDSKDWQTLQTDTFFVDADGNMIK